MVCSKRGQFHNILICILIQSFQIESVSSGTMSFKTVAMVILNLTKFIHTVTIRALFGIALASAISWLKVML